MVDQAGTDQGVGHTDATRTDDVVPGPGLEGLDLLGQLPRSAADLFDQVQRRFLKECSNGLVNLDALTALADITATRWKAFPAEVDGVDLSVRAERWTTDGVIDFLELSVDSGLDRAERDQAALHYLLAKQSLTVEQNQENKTQRVFELSCRPRCQHP
jgi:hypothetical protein